VTRQGAAVDIAVNSLAGIIGVQGDDTIETFGAQFLFDQENLAFFLPEEAIKILSVFSMPLIVIETPGIAHGVDEEFQEAPQAWVNSKPVQELDGRHDTRLLIAMNTGKDTDPIGGLS